MMTTHYVSDSRGPVEIASMNLRHAQNALAKLQRERFDDSRDAEIAALSDHVAKLSEEALRQQVTGGDTQTASFGDLEGVTL